MNRNSKIGDHRKQQLESEILTVLKEGVRINPKDLYPGIKRVQDGLKASVRLNGKSIDLGTWKKINEALYARYVAEERFPSVGRSLDHEREPLRIRTIRRPRRDQIKEQIMEILDRSQPD